MKNNNKYTPGDYIDFAMKMSDNAVDALIYLGLMMANGDKVAEKAYRQLDNSLLNQHR